MFYLFIGYTKYQFNAKYQEPNTELLIILKSCAAENHCFILIYFFDLTDIYENALFLGRNWHQMKYKTQSKTVSALMRRTVYDAVAYCVASMGKEKTIKKVCSCISIVKVSGGCCLAFQLAKSFNSSKLLYNITTFNTKILILGLISFPSPSIAWY